MLQFKNIFNYIGPGARVNFKQIAEVRKGILKKQGFDTSFLNWDLYAKVLEAKHARMCAK
jgi:hypothetical protein